jgi:hypothetical protein
VAIHGCIGLGKPETPISQEKGNVMSNDTNPSSHRDADVRSVPVRFQLHPVGPVPGSYREDIQVGDPDAFFAAIDPAFIEYAMQGVDESKTSRLDAVLVVLAAMLMVGDEFDEDGIAVRVELAAGQLQAKAVRIIVVTITTSLDADCQQYALVADQQSWVATFVYDGEHATVTVEATLPSD